MEERSIGEGLRSIALDSRVRFHTSTGEQLEGLFFCCDFASETVVLRRSTSAAYEDVLVKMDFLTSFEVLEPVPTAVSSAVASAVTSSSAKAEDHRKTGDGSPGDLDLDGSESGSGSEGSGSSSASGSDSPVGPLGGTWACGSGSADASAGSSQAEDVAALDEDASPTAAPTAEAVPHGNPPESAWDNVANQVRESRMLTEQHTADLAADLRQLQQVQVSPAAIGQDDAAIAGELAAVPRHLSLPAERGDAQMGVQELAQQLQSSILGAHESAQQQALLSHLSSPPIVETIGPRPFEKCD